MGMSLSTEVRMIKGVGPQRAQLLAERGIYTLEDLLGYLPFRYEDRIHFSKVRDIQPNGTYTIRARVMSGLTYTLEAKLPLDWRRSAATVGLLGLGASSILIVAAAAGGSSPFVPAGTEAFPGWLAGPFSLVHLRLGASAFEPLL